MADISNEETIAFYLQKIIDGLDSVVGDVPVSEQLGTALNYVAPKVHTHDEYATRTEVDELRRQIEILIDLVGDVPVSEQINNAISK